MAVRATTQFVRTGLVTSLFSYLGFFLLDVLLPGFVSRHMSVHIWFLPLVLFLWLWVKIGRPAFPVWEKRSFFGGLAIFLLVLCWRQTQEQSFGLLTAIGLSVVLIFSLWTVAQLVDSE